MRKQVTEEACKGWALADKKEGNRQWKHEDRKDPPELRKEEGCAWLRHERSGVDYREHGADQEKSLQPCCGAYRGVCRQTMGCKSLWRQLLPQDRLEKKDKWGRSTECPEACRLVRTARQTKIPTLPWSIRTERWRLKGLQQDKNHSHEKQQLSVTNI